MIRPLLVALLVAPAALALAAPAAADEAGYLKLQDRLSFLTADQLRTEGARICQAAASGMGSAGIVNMVIDDLDHTGLTVASANTMVATAIVELDC